MDIFFPNVAVFYVSESDGVSSEFDLSSYHCQSFLYALVVFYTLQHHVK